MKNRINKRQYLKLKVTMSESEFGKENYTIKINSIENLEKSRDYYGDVLLENLGYGNETMHDFISKFEDIYYISVSPYKINEYKENPAIYKILEKYKHTAESLPLEIMIFKNKPLSEDQKIALKEIVKIYGKGNNIQIDETPYSHIVGFFGGSTGRLYREIIKKIKEIYPVKNLEK